MIVSDGHDAANAAAALKLHPQKGKSSRAKRPPTTKRQALPADAEFILSALEAGAGSFAGAGANRRKEDRVPYRVSATLKLYSDNEQATPWTLYVRDIGRTGLGFVTKHRLPLGYGGILTIQTPDGKTLTVDCTLLRCREAIQGWFEGSMHFNREQPAFDNALVQPDES
jgi:hypothetical protein